MNKAAIVAGVGFDVVGNRSKMTVQIVQPGKLTPQTRGQSEQAVYVDEETGTTTFETIRNFTHEASRKLFWSHCQLFVVGAECAKTGVTSTLNWFYRNQELRPLAYIAMAENDAEDVIKTGATIEPVPAYQRANEVQVLTDSSNAPIVHLKDYMERSARPEGAGFMPVLDVAKKDTVAVTGTAVFLHDRFVGTLDHNESRGLLSLLGQVHSGTIVVPSRPRSGRTDHLTVEVISQRVRSKVQYLRGKPGIAYRIHYVVDLADDPDETAHSPQDFSKLEQRIGDEIKQRVMECVARTKTYHADVIGAGRTLERENPRLWRALTPKWDEVFPTIPVNVTVSVDLRQEGLIQGRK